jgi:transcriptional regulator with XRE-family HTH domain
MPNQHFQVEALANAVKSKRGDISLRKVAEELGDVSASTLSRLERHETIDLVTILRVCDWLNRPITDFIGASPKPLPEDYQLLLQATRTDIAIYRSQAEGLLEKARILEQRVERSLSNYHSGGSFYMGMIQHAPGK